MGVGRSNLCASIALRRETFATNMAQGPRSAKPHPLSGDQTPSNRINYFQTPSGPLRFFSADRVQRPPQLVRGAVMLVRKTCSMGFWHATALHKAAFDGVMSGKLWRIGQMIWAKITTKTELFVTSQNTQTPRSSTNCCW